MREQPHVGAGVPEADLVDQLTPVDPGGEDVELRPLAQARSEVSEADWVDQQLAVPHDDESHDDESQVAGEGGGVAE